MKESNGTPSPWPDVLAAGPLVALLLCLTALGWCAANATWSIAGWSLPTAHLDAKSDAYLDPEFNDVFVTLATMRAAADGHLIPLALKNIPELGAPFVANWNDWPLVEELPTILLGILGRLFGPFAGLNIGLLLGHLLAAATMYMVCIQSGCTAPLGFVAGLAFGLSPFIFAQSPHHVTVAWVWHVPLFLLAWQWVADPSLGPGDPRRRWAAVIGVITGLQNPYYANALCQLALLTGAATAWRERSRKPLQTAGIIVASTAAAFALMNVDSWLYRIFEGPNPSALVREYKWLEIYGLKIVDLFIPTAAHRSDLLAGFAAAHRASAPLLNEGAGYLGIVGLLSLAWLVATAVRALVEGRSDDVPPAFWQVSWIVVMFGTGGLNAVLGALGMTIFRGGCRYSVVILAIALLFAARRASTLLASKRFGPSSRLFGWGCAVALALLIGFDQVPRAPAASARDSVARQIDSDRDFIGRLDDLLPAGAMVFQLPLMEFPEAPMPGIPAYEQLRPYCLGSHLHWSFGTVKGRPREGWLRDLGTKDMRGVIAELRSRGFVAVVIHRNGFADKGRAIEASLIESGCKPPVRSRAGDLSCLLFDASDAKGGAR